MKSRFLALTSLCSFLTTGIGVARAATYYVGPNANGQGTARNSPASPTSVLSRVGAGDVVVFLDGTYTQPLELTRSGSAGSPITLRADDGTVPVIRGPGSGTADGLSAMGNVGHYVIEGLWFESWGTGGIGLDWDNDVNNVTIRYTVTDFNLRNGIAPYYAENVTIEYNISSRNGWGPDSWSSNFNIFGVKGKNNLVRNNVAFHGIDTSSQQSDGNGFILDITIDQGTALFENNVAFGNGGACIAVTDAGSAQLIGNTCYGNSQDAADYMDEFNFGNTCREGLVSEIPVNAKAYTFTNLVVRNNVAVPTVSGKDGVNTYSSSPCDPSMEFTNENNVIEPGAASALFENPAAADFRPKAGSALVDKIPHGTTFATDIGFDPKCIKTETDASKKKYPFWNFAPDLAYMKSIGGIKNCFSPITRPQGSNQEIGAYELGSRPSPGTGGASGSGSLPTAGRGGASSGSGGRNSGGAPVAQAGSSALAGAGSSDDEAGGEAGGCACTVGSRDGQRGAGPWLALLGLGTFAARRHLREARG